MQQNNNINNILSVGIDVSKSKLDICFITDNKPIYLTASNSKEGFNLLIEKMQSTTVPIIIESTGSYHINCALFLRENGFIVKLINPLISKAYSRAGVRKTKTDKADAKLIAEIGLKEPGLKTFTETKEDIELKQKFRLLEYLKKTRAQYKTKIKGLLEMSFVNTEIEIKVLKELIKALTLQIQQLSKEIVSSTKIQETSNTIGKIDGVSDIMLAGIVIELGEIERFDNYNQVIGFAGIDPSIKQSGSSINIRGALSKRGSNTLRGILFKVAWGLFMHNKTFKKYYDKKRAEGKHYYTCLIATARKFLVVLFTLLKKKQRYDIDFSI